jgi:hypothetical protein
MLLFFSLCPICFLSLFLPPSLSHSLSRSLSLSLPEHIKQRDNLTAQKTLSEIRNSYDRILTEKTEIEIRFSKLEEKNREEQRIIEDLRTKIRNIEDDKHNGLLSHKGIHVFIIIIIIYHHQYCS